MYEYRAHVVRVVDGDTVILDVDLGFTVSTRVTFRLANINTPEVIGRQTREAGLAAKKFLEDILEPGVAVTIKSQKPLKTDKYGRWLAEIFVGSRNVNQEMLDAGHAVKYP